MSVKQSKDQLSKLSTNELKKEGEKKAWVAINYYFDGGGNGPEAKVAVVAIGILAKELQANNNSRQLDFVETRLKQLNK